MLLIKSQVIGVAALAGLLWLRPSSVAPERIAPATLPTDSLTRAVATGNSLLFDLSLKEGAQINEPDAEGRSPLLVATLQHNPEAIRRLLELGADVDWADRNGFTPLMAAAQGDRELLEVFLERSRNPEATDSTGRSAAHYAVSAGRNDCFQLLLPCLSRLDVPAADGRDLLAFACDSANERMIATVLSNLPGGRSWTPQMRGVLRSALLSNDSELIRLLLDKFPASPTVEGGTTPLLAQAIVDDDAPLFRALLAAGADANTTLPVPSEKEFNARIRAENLRGYVQADRGITLLMLAAGMGKVEYVRALLDAGADKNRQTARYKMLALYFAARTKEAKCVQMLLGQGPSREELRVEISLASQRASLIKDGVAILRTSISTGRKGFDTPAGEYVITDKARSHRSTLYHAEMPYFMRLNCLDFGLHAGVVPNYPASHGCIRLPAEIAQKIFSEVPVGTMVTIN